MSGGAYPPGCSQADLDAAQSCGGCGRCDECTADEFDNMTGRHGAGLAGENYDDGESDDMTWKKAKEWQDSAKKSSGGGFVSLKDGDRLECVCLGEPAERLNAWGRKQWTINVWDLTEKAIKLYPMPASVFREFLKVNDTTAGHFGGLGAVALYVARTGSGKENTRYEAGFLRPLEPTEQATIGAITDDQLMEIRDYDGPGFDTDGGGGASNGGGADRGALRAAATGKGAGGYSDGDIPF